MMILGVGLTLSAFAGQPKLASGTRLSGGIRGGAPAKVIVVRPAYNYGYYRPYGFGYYSPFYSPYYAYNPFYSPYGYQRYESKLDLEIEQINNDYQHQIADARHDETLTKAGRKQKIRDLRHERENSIIEAKKGYYNRQEKEAE